jgi:hypothetical protein
VDTVHIYSNVTVPLSPECWLQSLQVRTCTTRGGRELTYRHHSNPGWGSPDVASIDLHGLRAAVPVRYSDVLRFSFGAMTWQDGVRPVVLLDWYLPLRVFATLRVFGIFVEWNSASSRFCVDRRAYVGRLLCVGRRLRVGCRPFVSIVVFCRSISVVVILSGEISSAFSTFGKVCV